jgi:O-antigen/teichoic acid export membrane protein
MSAKIHARNLMFNWGGHAASMVVMFFLSPYIVGKLDAIAYGIWSLLTVLTGYMGLFDLGVRASVGRHIALYLGKGDQKGVDESIRAGLGFFSFTGALILALGVFLGWLFPQVFKDVPVEYHGTVRMLLPLMVVNVWLAAVAAVYSSVLAAHDRFDVARSVDLVVLIVRTAATVYALHRGWGLWGLAGAVVVGNVLGMWANWLAAHRYHTGLRSWPFLYRKNRLKEIISYGVASFLSAFSARVIGQTDLIIAGALISIADVREYSVGAMVVFYSSTFVKLIGRTFFPAFQRAIGAGKMGEARHLFERQVRLALCFGLLVYIGFATYSHSFIRLWMLQDGFGEASVAVSASVMTVLALAQLPMLYALPSLDMLAAMGYIRFNAIISMTEAVVNLGLSLFFVIVLHWGLVGIAAGSLAGRLLVSCLWVPIYLDRKQGFDLKRLFRSIVAPGFAAAGFFYFFCRVQLWVFLPGTWLSFGLQIFLAVLFWSMIAMLIILPADYRQRLGLRLRRFHAKAFV